MKSVYLLGCLQVDCVIWKLTKYFGVGKVIFLQILLLTINIDVTLTLNGRSYFG